MFSFLAQLPDWKLLDEVLLWIVGGGFSVIVAAVFAFLAENFEFWHRLNKNIKLLISLLLSSAIGAGAYYLLSMPDLITLVQPYWALVITMLLAWLGSQYAYIKTKNAGYAAKAQASALGLKKK